MSMFYKNFKEIDTVLTHARHVYVFTHARPDGDAIGSLCAMVGYLKMRGVSYTAFSADAIPATYSSLPWTEEVVTPEHVLWNKRTQTPDVVVMLDVFEQRRTGMQDVLKRVPRTQYVEIILDHHPTDTHTAEYAVIKPLAGSTTELLYDFFIANDLTISQPLAQSLLMGLITDTENFTNRGTSKHSLDVAQALIHHGAEVAKLTNWSYSKELIDLKQIGQALSTLIYNAEHGIVSTVIQEKSEQPNQGEAKGLVNFMKRISCGTCVALIKETSEGIKISLRSQDDAINVRSIAQYGGGGGHNLAAGFVVKGRLQHNGTHWEVVD